MRALLITLGIVAVLFSASGIAQAARLEELQDQIQSRKQEIESLEQEVIQHQRDLEIVGNEKKTLQSTVKEIDLTRKKLGTDISLTQKKIDTTSLTIEELGIEIKDKEIRIERGRETIAKIIRLIHESSQDTMIELLLAHDTLSEVFTDADNLTRVEEEMNKQVGELKVLQGGLEDQRKKTEETRNQLKRLSDQIQDQKRLADQKRKEQATLLAETQNKESNFKKLLTDKQTRIKQFERDIDDFEDQLRVELDPNSIPSPGSKALAWPLDSVFITQKFGSTQSAKRLYTSGTHNGIDFRATVGTAVKAAGTGVVVETGDTDRTCRGASYGRWVLLRHNNGLSTLYAHLDLIRVQKGDPVTPGHTIGYSGNTGYSTGPHLHFTVFATAAVRVSDLPSSSCKNALYRIPVAPRNGYLDPEGYLY